jgi:hypothetical protein
MAPNILNLDKVSSQHDEPAAFVRGKRTSAQLDRRLIGQKCSPNATEKRRDLTSLPGNEILYLSRPAHSIVIVSTTVFQEFSLSIESF